MNYYKGKTILITGGTGSWGQELVRQLLEADPKEIRVYSRGEHAQVDMMRKFNHPRLDFYIGDVRDRDRLDEALRGVDVVFHLAALKHVPVCERHIWETVQTNAAGTQNVADIARKNNIAKAILVSSDKSVDPINLYGHTKAIAEKIFITANTFSGVTKFACIRAGNILGTQGSVVPLFRNQIKRHNMVTLTDSRMTRFLIAPSEMIKFLVAQAALAKGGEIIIPKMPAVAIMDLIQVMIDALGNKTTKAVDVGIRAGEKLHEFLLSEYERGRTIEYPDRFVVLPYDFIFKGIPTLQGYQTEKVGVGGVYSSESAMRLTKTAIQHLLGENHYL